MAAPKGIAAVEWLARRTKAQRGGNDRRPDNFDRSAPDALALWRDGYLESLGVPQLRRRHVGRPARRP